MKDTILLSNCWERLPNNLGYISTFIHYNRNTNEVVRLSYSYHPEFACSSSKSKHFNSHEELMSFLEDKSQLLSLVDDEQLN